MSSESIAVSPSAKKLAHRTSRCAWWEIGARAFSSTSDFGDERPDGSNPCLLASSRTNAIVPTAPTLSGTLDSSGVSSADASRTKSS